MSKENENLHFMSTPNIQICQDLVFFFLQQKIDFPARLLYPFLNKQVLT